MPKVSVVIPCYNMGKYLDEAVDSVLAQTFTDFEIIIVDDGSTDTSTCELLADYSKPKTKVIHTANRGVAAARNSGIEEAVGEYVLPLDADDRIGEFYLEKAVAVLDQQADIGIVYCCCKLFGAVEREWSLPPFSLPHQLLDNLIFSAAVFRKKAWSRVRGYDSSLRQGWEDWDFWLRLLAEGTQVFRLPEMLFYYRIRPDSRDRSISFFRRINLMLKIINNNRQLYFRNALKIVNIIIKFDRRRPAPIRVNGWLNNAGLL